MAKKSQKIEELLAEDGAAAENYEVTDQLPEHVQVSRPNLGRATVVSVRLSPEEHTRLQSAADDRRVVEFQTEMSSMTAIVSRIWARVAAPTLPRTETIRPVDTARRC